MESWQDKGDRDGSFHINRSIELPRAWERARLGFLREDRNKKNTCQQAIV